MIELVSETHSTTVDNEEGRATGWLPGVARFDGARIVLVSHAAPRWALEYLLAGRPLEELVVEPFDWQPGCLYRLDRERQPQG